MAIRPTLSGFFSSDRSIELWPPWPVVNATTRAFTGLSGPRQHKRRAQPASRESRLAAGAATASAHRPKWWWPDSGQPATSTRATAAENSESAVPQRRRTTSPASAGSMASTATVVRKLTNHGNGKTQGISQSKMCARSLPASGGKPHGILASLDAGELGHDFGGQALDLLGLAGERVEQDRPGARLRHLAQPLRARVRRAEDRDGGEVGEREVPVELLQAVGDLLPSTRGVIVHGDVDAFGDREGIGIPPRLRERGPHDLHLLGEPRGGGRPGAEKAVAVLDRAP